MRFARVVWSPHVGDELAAVDELVRSTQQPFQNGPFDPSEVNTRVAGPCHSLDLRHTYASLAGADLRLLQKSMGHASITVTAHIYADLYDDELDDIASALDALDDVRGDHR
jgi:integrase